MTGLNPQEQFRQDIEAAAYRMLEADGLAQTEMLTDWGIICSFTSVDSGDSLGSYFTIYHSANVSGHTARGLHYQAITLLDPNERENQ